MCFVEFNWVANVYAFRIGDRFTDFKGWRYLESLDDWRAILKSEGLALRKTASRTWQVVSLYEVKPAA